MVEQSQQIGVLSMDITYINSEIPHIFRGASSSRKIGCYINIYRLRVHRPLISLSSRFTCRGTFEFLTDNSLSIMLSTLISTLRSISTIITFEFQNLNINYTSQPIEPSTHPFNAKINSTPNYLQTQLQSGRHHQLSFCSVRGGEEEKGGL